MRAFRLIGRLLKRIFREPFVDSKTTTLNRERAAMESQMHSGF